MALTDHLAGPVINATSDAVGFRNVGTVYELLQRSAELWPQRVAIITTLDGAELTYEEFHDRVHGVASALTQLGISAGDRVAVMMQNRAEYPVVWLACSFLGCIMVPVNSNYKIADAGYVVRHSGASIAIVDEGAENIVRRLEHCPALRHIVNCSTLRDSDRPPADSPPEHSSRSTTEILLNIQYTSGTTGEPKGCMLTNAYWLAMAKKNVTESPRISSIDRLLAAQPFSYMDPQWMLASALSVGAKFILLDRFHPTTFMKSVRLHRATYFYCIGVMPTLLLKIPPAEDDKTHDVRIVTCSGIPKNLHAELESRFGVPWLETYGLTEIGNATSVSPEEHDFYVGTGALGRATSGREIRVVNPEDDRPVPRGQIGEVLIRGVAMMDGYFRDAGATATAFRNGWFHTGDLAQMDSSGVLYFRGRSKQVIRRSGETIAVTEVENALVAHPCVSIVACVPVPDELRGEEVKVYVVLDEEHGNDCQELKEDGLANYLTKLLAYFKVPRYWEYRPSLPLTPSGKVATRDLDDERAQCWDRVERVWQ